MIKKILILLVSIVPLFAQWNHWQGHTNWIERYYKLIYISDFSSGIDNWNSAGTNLNAPYTEPNTGVGNCMKVVATNTTGIHRVEKRNILTEAGKTYKVTGQVYLPSGNTNVNKVKIYTGYSNEGYVDITTTDQWVYFIVYITITAYRYLDFYAYKDNNESFTGAGSSSDDMFYIKNIKVKLRR